ncbi:hypothetical protein PVAG01_05331 [Phlyctema vagabunda]|uniref:Uncharacterized protein n=1 Tax=Phlyctema vagabunda TaxID=108571 RepID=A0ABR4PJW7_9HELO
MVLSRASRRSTLNVIRIIAAAAILIICKQLYAFEMENFSDPPLPTVIENNFPIGATGVPSIPAWNMRPTPNITTKTHLFIGFIQNWLLLQQAVVSYLAAGWPASDIIVVDNTGTMGSNKRSQLTLQNPSFLNHQRLCDTLGVKVLSTPSLLSFAQLQNFYLYEAIHSNWTYYFWSHMDVAVLSSEDTESGVYQSLYSRVVVDLYQALLSTDWAVRFYAYDRLALVSVPAYEAVGGFDTMIPYYPTDCDMYERLNMAGYHNPSPEVGHIFDVASSIEDLTDFYRVGLPNSTSYQNLFTRLKYLEMRKNREDVERNNGQDVQRGGQGEPYHRDVGGSNKARSEMIKAGRRIFKQKWGTSECRLHESGVRLTDAWASGFRRTVMQWP